MNILEAIILGLIQGITEWLPISSSGHLAIAQHLFGLKEPVGMGIILHLSSLLAVLILLRKDIFSLMRGFLEAIREKTGNKETSFILSIIIATIPIAVIGLLFRHQIEASFSNIKIVGICLMITAAILWFTKYCKPRTTAITLKDSFIIGLFQAAAVLPGISRSGSTISAALYRNIDREKAAKFSLLLFIPAIAGASILEYDSIGNISLLPAIIAFSVSFITSLIFIRWLILIVKNSRLHWFSPYCLLLGIVALFI